MKRGRPRVIPQEAEANLRKVLEIPSSATERSVQNRLYVGRAAQSLQGNRQVTWLLDGEGTLYKRKTLLSQLGRVKNPEARSVFAERLCQIKPTAQEGVILVREWQERWESIAACHIVEGESVNATEIAAKVCRKK